MNIIAPLIRTKLHLPFTRPGLVSRPRLQERMAQGLGGPLTVVIAPAGFGKTTLVTACISGCELPVAWFSIDKNDNQAGRFLNYLVAALREADRTIGSEAAQLVTASPEAPAEAVLTSLINDLDAAGKEMALVLDDYHFVSSPGVHAAAAFLLEHCPRTLHVIIASRSDPPLPVARLRARGQAVELRADDLRFSQAEAAQFLNDVMGLHLDTGSVAALEAQTEGWIAGLQMAALSMRDRKDIAGFIEGFSGTNRYILDYLLEEVLAGQPPEIQHFLQYTSILERLSAPLCDAVLTIAEGDQGAGKEDYLSHQRSASILEYLERENLFLVSLDDERTWFRYHNLFADLLRVRLQQQAPTGFVPGLHLRASAWLEKNGFIAEAIQHLLAAQNLDRAADLIELYGSARWAESDLSVVQMADDLPYQMLIDRPKIGLYQTWLHINQGHIEKTYPLLKNLEQQLTDADPKNQWIITIVRLALAFLGEKPSTPNIDLLPDDQALDQIPGDEIVLRDAADILYGMTLGRRGEMERAAEFSLKCLQKRRRGMPTISPLVPFLTTIYLFQGRLHAAAALCKEFLDPIKEQGILVSTAGNMDVVLGDVLYEWNRLDEAEKHIREGLKANESWGNIMTDTFGLLALTQVLVAKGDYPGAMEMVEKLETRLQAPTRPVEFEEPYRTQKIRVQLASGDINGAAQWADQILLTEDFHLHRELYLPILAHIRLAQGRYGEAEDILKEVSGHASAGNQLVRQLESQLILAAALAGQQRLPEAFGVFETCLALAEPEGYLSIFMEIGEPVRDLAAAYLKSEHSGYKPYAQKVLDAFSPANKLSVHDLKPDGLVEPLTERELEVLALIAAGRTNQEAARQLIVAPGTIKAHTASIFRKLGVANRTEAAARGRDLGLLP